MAFILHISERMTNVSPVLLCNVIAILLCGTLQAQDKVSYTPKAASRPMTLVGEILDYNGRSLRFKSTNGEIQTVDSASIVGIETQYSNSYLSGIQLFNSGETTNALHMFQQAMEEESRSWVDRELQAWIVKCYHREQNFSAVLMAFETLVQQDSETRHWNIAPLVWASLSTSDEVRAQARQWMIGSTVSTQLLGASILLLDPTYTKSAESLMKQLTQNANSSISTLAQCQLWRIDLSNRNIDEFKLRRLEDQLERIPKHLRNGPRFLLGAAYGVNQQYRQSVAEYMWVPLVHSEHEPLNSRATLEAAEALERTGLADDANLLYRELVSRYPWSIEAKTARTKLSN